MFHAPSIQQEIPFEFRIRYKFLSQTEAVVRYGASTDLFDLGRVSPGTYCTRQFEECYRNKCRLQSPNYPGMYPRNVTCYWTIRQKTVPTCKHAMISVSQENSHKSLVKRSIASLNKTARTVRAWAGEHCGKKFTHLFSRTPHSTCPVNGVANVEWSGKSGHHVYHTRIFHHHLMFFFHSLLSLSTIILHP